MDYKELAEDLLSGCEENCADCKYAGDSEFECTIAQLSAIAITDLIKYKEAIDRMGEFGKQFLPYSGCPRGMIGEAGYVAQVVHGEWQQTEYPIMSECEDCSECGYRTMYGHGFKFCPNCGARMDGTEEK